MAAPPAPDICVPLAKYLRTDLAGLSADEIRKRDEACHQWTGFKSWKNLYDAWLLCKDYWGLVISDPKNYHKILQSFIKKGFPAATHPRTHTQLDEFILSWAYAHTSINLSLLATMMKMSRWHSLNFFFSFFSFFFW